jgi:four helix bundle protein
MVYSSTILNQIILKNQPIQDRSLEFAVRIYKICQEIQKKKKEYSITNQIIRSSSSIGANSFEAINAQSKADFIHKLSISLKETSETQYWLKFMVKTDLINELQFQKNFQESIEIHKIISTIILRTKENINQKNSPK